MITHKDRSSGIGVESLQCTVKDLAIWLVDALGLGNQDGVEHGRKGEAFQLAALHANGAIRDEAELQARGAKGRKGLCGIREQQTHTRKSGTVIIQQSLSQAGRKLELCDQAVEQFLPPWPIPVAITLYKGLNVLLLVYSPDEVRKPFPLISNEPIEASTAIK